MDRQSLITAILGAIVGVAVVLIFSFVVAEKLVPKPAPGPGKTLAGGGGSAQRQNNSNSLSGGQVLSADAPYGHLNGVDAVRSVREQPGQLSELQILGLLPILGEQGILSRAVTTLEQAAGDIGEQALSLMGGIKGSFVGSLLPVATGIAQGVQPANTVAEQSLTDGQITDVVDGNESSEPQDGTLISPLLNLIP